MDHVHSVDRQGLSIRARPLVRSNRESLGSEVPLIYRLYCCVLLLDLRGDKDNGIVCRTVGPPESHAHTHKHTHTVEEEEWTAPALVVTVRLSQQQCG